MDTNPYIIYNKNTYKIIETLPSFGHTMQFLLKEHKDSAWINITNPEDAPILYKIGQANEMDSDELKAMKKKISLAKFRHVQLNKNGEIVVNTPKPYVVTEDYKPRTYDTMYRLNEKCKFLYNIMKLLRISTGHAATMDFSLNKITGDKIIEIAMSDENRSRLSHEVIMLIKNHNW